MVGEIEDRGAAGHRVLQTAALQRPPREDRRRGAQYSVLCARTALVLDDTLHVPASARTVPDGTNLASNHD
jgi:hypothetical protein